MNARMELKRCASHLPQVSGSSPDPFGRRAATDTDPAFQGYGSETYAPLSMDRPSPILHIPQHVQLDDPIEGRAACHVVVTHTGVPGSHRALRIHMFHADRGVSE